MKSVKTALETWKSGILLFWVKDQHVTDQHLTSRIFFKDISDLFASILFKLTSHQYLHCPCVYMDSVLQIFSNTS